MLKNKIKKINLKKILLGQKNTIIKKKVRFDRKKKRIMKLPNKNNCKKHLKNSNKKNMNQI
jgi:hypothetical protein